MSENAHPFTTEDAVDYHDGQLPAERRAAFEAHLPSCEDCRRTLDAAEVALGALDARLTEPPPIDVDAAIAIMRRAEREVDEERARRRRVFAIAGLVGAAAAAAFAAAALLERKRPAAPRQEIAEPPQKLPLEREDAPVAPKGREGGSGSHAPPAPKRREGPTP